MYESTYPTVAQRTSGGFAQAPATDFTLFSAPAVTLATFFGTPAAGSVLMALNYRRMGEKGQALVTLLIGFLVTGLAIGLGFIVHNTLTTPLGIGLLLGTRVLAVKMQGEAVAQHVSRGGRLGSKWVAFGVGIAFLCAIFLAVFIPVYANSVHSKVIVGSKDEVFYTGAATEEDARALGDALKKSGYFTDRGTSVFLGKDKDGTTVSLVMKEGVWDQPGMLLSAEMVVREVADSVGGFPVRVKLIDSSENLKKEGTIGRAAIGKDEVFYFGEAKESEAAALGKALRAEEYLTNRGSSVLLSREAGITTISFVVADGFWNDGGHVAGFEKLTRAVAASVGGLPVTVRLVNTTLENKKEFVVN
jgi:hypothetical protein